MFSPLHWHLMEALRDPAIRFIFIEGGSSAAKTFEICRALEIEALQQGTSTIIFRRFGVDIVDSVYSSFKVAAATLGPLLDRFSFQQHLIKLRDSEARFRFRGLDDDENIKGIEGFDRVYNNEWSQFIERHWDQQRKRLRGRPNQKFICDWNPINAKLWQYENLLDRDQWTEMPLDVKGAPTKYSSLNPEYSFKRINKRGNTIWIKTTYRDNFWIVGHPSGKGGFVDQATLDDFEYDRIHKPNLYRVYANGERGILRTGGEFFKQFDETKHVRPVKYEPGTIHITLDENVNPYVTVGAWQVFPDRKLLRQIHEIPCKSPENNAPKAAARVAAWLKSLDYRDTVFIYGDPSASRRSTVDPNSSSFYDKFVQVLRSDGFTVRNRVQRSAPEVSLSADFINEIYENQMGSWSIEISDRCKVSIEDYAFVKEAPDGSMVKEKKKDPETGVTYEPHGHFSDAKRYLITTVLDKEFNQYKARGKRARSIAV